MNSIFSLSTQVCNDLKENLNLENVNVITKYPNVIKAAPLKKSIICIGLKHVEFINGGIGSNKEKIADVELEVLVFVPFCSDSLTCMDITQKVFEHLWKNSVFNFTKYNVEELEAKKHLGAYQLRGSIKTQINTTKVVESDV